MKALGGSDLACFVVASREEAEHAVADEVAELARSRPGLVLGLPTGNTPVGVYAEWVARHRAGRLSLAGARTFNVDEYLDLAPDDPRTFRAWMQSRVFAHLDVPTDRIHIPGSRPIDPRAEAERYERAIHAAGGLDLLLLGIGRNGHIGFNEPGAPRDSRTRVVDLAPLTRSDASPQFGGPEHVPARAITMGIATLLSARRIRVLAFGTSKAEIVRRTRFDPVGSGVPATFLRGHPDVRLYVDPAAGSWLP